VLRHPSTAYPSDMLQAFKFVSEKPHRDTANRERIGIEIPTWEMGQTEPLGNVDSNGPIVPIPVDRGSWN
jgi:hypothetical protein